LPCRMWGAIARNSFFCADRSLYMGKDAGRGQVRALQI
jgi:hypothetical protein